MRSEGPIGGATVRDVAPTGGSMVCFRKSSAPAASTLAAMLTPPTIQRFQVILPFMIVIQRFQPGGTERQTNIYVFTPISAKETRALPALRACTIARDSAVGNSQSEVNEITQNRVGVSLKALASTPP